MKKSDIVCVVGSMYAAATTFFYCWPMWFSWLTLPRYYPEAHEWRLGKTVGEISQGWYGMQGFAYLAAGVVALIAYFLVKRFAKNDLKPGVIKLIGVAMTVVMVVCLGYIMYHEFHKWGVFCGVR
jgi:ABC-type Fe3+-siderophore transport system permease subunit